MKKLFLLVTVLMLSFVFVACDNEVTTNDYENQIEALENEIADLESNNELLQEQIDEINEALNDRYVQKEVGTDLLYYHCSVDSEGVQTCFVIDFVTETEYNERLGGE